MAKEGNNGPLDDIWRCKRLRCVLEGSIWSLRSRYMMVCDGYGGYSCSQRVRWSLRRYSMVSLHNGWYLLDYGGGSHHTHSTVVPHYS